MLLKFLKNIQGMDRDSKGIAMPLRLYKKDEQTEVGQELAQVFLKLGAAEIPKETLDEIKEMEKEPKKKEMEKEPEVLEKKETGPEGPKESQKKEDSEIKEKKKTRLKN